MTMTERVIQIRNIHTVEELMDQLTLIHGDGLVDLRHNRLGAHYLPRLIDWLSVHPDARLCVGMTGISIGEICKACMEKQNSLELVMHGRLSLGFYSDERELDIIHAAGFKEGREVSFVDAMSQLRATQANLNEASAITRHLAASAADDAAERKSTSFDLRTFRSSCENLRRSVRDLDQWRSTINDRYEVMLTHLLRIHLQRQDIVEDSVHDIWEMPKMFTRVDPPDEKTRLGQVVSPYFNHGFEWDGALYIPSRGHLYLVEAKSNLDASHVSTMENRLVRTVSFMQSKSVIAREAADRFMKSEGLTNKEKTASFCFIELCDAWRKFQNVSGVFGVIGGLGFTKNMLSNAKERGLICIYPASGSHIVDSPSCVKNFIPQGEDSPLLLKQESNSINDDDLREEIAESLQDPFAR